MDNLMDVLNGYIGTLNDFMYSKFLIIILSDGFVRNIGEGLIFRVPHIGIPGQIGSQSDCARCGLVHDRGRR